MKSKLYAVDRIEGDIAVCRTLSRRAARSFEVEIGRVSGNVRENCIIRRSRGVGHDFCVDETETSRRLTEAKIALDRLKKR